MFVAYRFLPGSRALVAAQTLERLTQPHEVTAISALPVGFQGVALGVQVADSAPQEVGEVVALACVEGERWEVSVLEFARRVLAAPWCVVGVAGEVELWRRRV